MKFTYRSGQRPLEGYTLKRGVGQGGFGEVYFAISDGGKEVALKLLRGHSDVELRGVANCLNMKHPNLVHVYDLKEDSFGGKWLIMEYVLGESLAQTLQRNPLGLPLGLVKEWFGSLARAVAHLHDRGVVHRDLKPANIFIESGTLKVGDYGLCKTLSSSERQTRTVGTVHYMAPEVSTGNYSQKIDIYACGVILHEMLTGKVPFDGQTDGEILMKHLTATPDLSSVPEPFRPLVAKALDKNPVKRYNSIVEMAKVVDSTFLQLAQPVLASPPVTAKPVVATIAAPLPDSTPTLPPPGFVPVIPVAKPQQPDETPIILPDPKVGKKLDTPRPGDATPLPLAKAVTPPTWQDRALGLTQSLLLAPAVAFLGLIPYGLLANTPEWIGLSKLWLITSVLAWAVLIGSGTATARSPDSWGRRLRIGGLGALAGAFAFWLDGWTMPRMTDFGAGIASETYLFGLIHLPQDTFATALRYLLYFGGVFTAGRWWKMAARDRKERFGLFPVVASGFWASVLLFLWPWQSGSATAGIMPIVLCAIAVQAVSPWTPPPPSPPKKLKYRAAK
jgi:serine/threonine protein kinase